MSRFIIIVEVLTCIDPEEFLPPTTMAWCQKALTVIGITGPIEHRKSDSLNFDPGIGGLPLHRKAYRYLRGTLESTRAADVLETIENPTEPMDWLREHNLPQQELD